MHATRICIRWLLAVCVVGLWAIALGADPIAPAATMTDELEGNPMCGMQVLLLQTPPPSASDVGLPAFPDALFTGATGPGSGDADGETFEVLASVFLLTTAAPDEVADFYAEALDETWTRGVMLGSHVFYQHEPVDDVAALLFERPGVLPVVEIVDVWSNCDRALMPDARTSIRLYYPPDATP